MWHLVQRTESVSTRQKMKAANFILIRGGQFFYQVSQLVFKARSAKGEAYRFYRLSLTLLWLKIRYLHSKFTGERKNRHKDAMGTLFLPRDKKDHEVVPTFCVKREILNWSQGNHDGMKMWLKTKVMKKWSNKRFEIKACVHAIVTLGNLQLDPQKFFAHLKVGCIEKEETKVVFFQVSWNSDRRIFLPNCLSGKNHCILCTLHHLTSSTAFSDLHFQKDFLQEREKPCVVLKYITDKTRNSRVFIKIRYWWRESDLLQEERSCQAAKLKKGPVAIRCQKSPGNSFLILRVKIIATSQPVYQVQNLSCSNLGIKILTLDEFSMCLC